MKLVKCAKKYFLAVSFGAIAGILISSVFFKLHIEKDIYNEGQYLSFLKSYRPPALINTNNTSPGKFKTRILCWILTGPANHATKAIHVLRTWGKRCDKLLFMTSLEDPDLPGSVKLEGVQEGRGFLWHKSRAATLFIAENYIKDYDFVLKADDDTYVVMENLRHFLKDLDPSRKLFTGYRFQNSISGGAGYVLSNAAVRAFAEIANMNDSDLCATAPPNKGGGDEDVQMTKCLTNAKVSYVDSRDKAGCQRFFPLSTQKHMAPELFIKDAQLQWYINTLYYKDTGQCVSESTISFHYLQPSEFYAIEFFIYNFSKANISLV